MFPDVSSALPRRNKTAITSEDGVDTAIELILNAHRYASTGLDEANELPLHWLCRNVSATVNTVDEVWQAFPDAAAECAQNAELSPADIVFFARILLRQMLFVLVLVAAGFFSKCDGGVLRQGGPGRQDASGYVRRTSIFETTHLLEMLTFFLLLGRSKDRFKVLTGKYAPVSTPLIHSFITFNSTKKIPRRFKSTCCFPQVRGGCALRESMQSLWHDP
eukprot:COSAG04_NODE_714_length_10864_cov_6.272550_3_plen_219_part_00